MDTKQNVRSDFTTALDLAIQRRIDEIVAYIKDGWGSEEAIAYVERSSTLGPASWARVLDAVNQAVPMAQPPADPPMARAPAAPMQQATLFDGTLTGDAAALAERQQIPRVLLTELALAQLDANRQAVVMADLGTGRIVTVAALRKRIKALGAAQATESATAFAWGA